MKITFLDFTGFKKYPDMEKEKGMGCSDRCILEITKNTAAKGHEVHFYTNTDFQGVAHGVQWHNLVQGPIETDLLVVHRMPFRFEQFKYKKLIFWMQDNMDAPVNLHIDKFLELPNKFIVLSKYHADQLHNFQVPYNKIAIIGEGLDKKFYDQYHYSTDGKNFYQKTNDPFVLAYASSPVKGLHILMKMWPEIKKEIPGVKLNICSGMALYGAAQQDAFFKKIYDDANADPDITLHGVKTNKEVFKILEQSTILAFPNRFVETFCAAAYESIAAVCPVVATNTGALPEVVDNCGILVSGDPFKPEYWHEFIAQLKSLAFTKSYYERLKMNCIEKRPAMKSWQDRADEFEEVVRGLNGSI
ncbi:MAG: glycosyltransferase family 4 protein [Oscillospiraceae bacterium]|jgi:glycosyltransferase involved in cell wall biosynthesis